jgi:hypothetical protein
MLKKIMFADELRNIIDNNNNRDIPVFTYFDLSKFSDDDMIMITEQEMSQGALLVSGLKISLSDFSSEVQAYINYIQNQRIENVLKQVFVGNKELEEDNNEN